MQFSNWLLHQESLLESFQEAKELDYAVSKLLGTRGTWVQMAVRSASRNGFSGMDAQTVGTQAVEDLILDLSRQPALKAAFEAAAGNESETIRVYLTAINLRVRRDGAAFRRKNISKHHLSQMGPEGTDFSGIATTKDQADHSYRLDALKRRVLDELDRMSSETNRRPTKLRLSLAKEVAIQRMKYAPHPVPLSELMRKFRIKKTKMFLILKDIEEAVRRAGIGQGGGE